MYSITVRGIAVLVEGESEAQFLRAIAKSYPQQHVELLIKNHAERQIENVVCRVSELSNEILVQVKHLGKQVGHSNHQGSANFQSAPGSRLVGLCRKVLSRNAVERVLMPNISDMQIQWRDAVHSDTAHHRYLGLLIGYLNLARALALYAFFAVLKLSGLLRNGRSISSKRNNSNET